MSAACTHDTRSASPSVGIGHVSDLRQGALPLHLVGAGDTTPTGRSVLKASKRVSASEKRRADLLERAERRRHEVAVALDNSQEVLAKARAFTRKYDGISVERAESQSFWNDLLGVFGIDRRSVGADFERPARRADTGGPGRIDMFWPRVLLAEHKSTGKDFAAALAQADAYELEPHERPRLTVVCDFQRFLVRDNHTGRSTEFGLVDFPDRLGWFGPLVHDELTELAPQRPVDVKAAEAMAELHDALRAAGYSGHNLRVLMTRLLFCFFADDARIWARGKLDAYLRSAPPAFAGAALAQLFEVLNTPPAERSAMLDESLAVFPYVNGGLFAELIPITNLSAELLDAMIATSEDVDWSSVSPAVFGAMFQGVMDATERHELGAHYTSEENILRLIESLFLDDLYQAIEDASSVPALERVWQRMSDMRLLDPAAGCGNFLVVSYRELRRVERHLMEKIRGLVVIDQRFWDRYPWAVGQRFLDSSAATRLGVGQFHGIEIDEWPAQIAQVAMWLTDHLANMELEEQFGGHQTRLPLTDTAHITVGNALEKDWKLLLGGTQATHVLGNPPFLGTNLQSPQQKADTEAVWGKTRGAGSLDYVCNWFRRAAEYIDGTDTRVAFVATNSITQGEQPPVLWTFLGAKDIHIDFAHRPFNWSNEARGKAAVHVVVIGFSQGRKPGQKPLWSYPDISKPGIRALASRINAYLVDAPEVLVRSTKLPLQGFNQMYFGSMARDGGHLLLSPEEAAEIREKDPAASRYLRQIVGAAEMIQGKERWCLWLVGAEPSDLRTSPTLRSRLQEVALVRAASPAGSTQAAAATPGLFVQIAQPSERYLAVPRVSSVRRNYVPVRFYEPEVVASDLLMIVPGADLATFAALSSSAFTIWNRAVSGRLKSDCRISAEVTYNNFPWPALSDSLRLEIERRGQSVLDARAEYPGASLADLYDPVSMPPGLVKAHRELDRVVLQAFGLSPGAGDADVLATLFQRYEMLADRP